jgi:hypothetical protein
MPFVPTSGDYHTLLGSLGNTCWRDIAQKTNNGVREEFASDQYHIIVLLSQRTIGNQDNLMITRKW